MAVDGIESILVMVSDLEAAVAFYEEGLGLSEVTRGEVDPMLRTSVWGSGADGAHSVVLMNDVQPTRVELVALDPPGRDRVRDRVRTFDLGLFDIAFLVADAQRVAARLDEWGYGFLTRPYQYPPFSSGSRVVEGFAYGPSREVVALIQYIEPPVSEKRVLPGDVWTMMDVAQWVDDVDDALGFYRDLLGLTVMSDVTSPRGFFDQVLHLPCDSQLRIVTLNTPESCTPVVELVCMSAGGNEIRPRKDELGVFAFSFATDDIGGDVERVREGGRQILFGPTQVERLGIGQGLAAEVEAPHGVRVQLFQRGS